MLKRVLALIAVALLPSVAAAEPPVTHFQLDNGMDVVVVEDHRVPVVTHMVWYRIGAADEPRGVSGIAHFLEHLMFKGTDEIPDGAFSKIIAANGGQDNAFTSQDYTGYFQRIAADRLDLIMKMEADRMTDLVITEEHILKERAVILEERSSRMDNSPAALFTEQLQAALYLNHPYGLSVSGWRHEMEQLSMEDALDFYARYYAPDNAILVVAGNVTPEQVRSLAETHYGPIPAAGTTLVERPQEPPQRAPRRIEMSDARVGQPFMARYYLVPAYDPDDPKTSAALLIGARVLGDGVGSRLSSAIQVRDQMAIGTGAGYNPRSRDATTFTLYGVPAEGTKLEEIEAALDRELEAFIESGPTDEELTRVKRIMRASRIFSQDSQSSLARSYGAALAMGFSVEDVQGWPDVIEAVTAEDVKNALREHLKIEASATGYLRTAEGEG
ncbi:MAG: M16 family metallopeptidase [Paracoccaceae bacterium]